VPGIVLSYGSWWPVNLEVHSGDGEDCESAEGSGDSVSELSLRRVQTFSFYWLETRISGQCRRLRRRTEMFTSNAKLNAEVIEMCRVCCV
jgi:hypothetical protein